MITNGFIGYGYWLITIQVQELVQDNWYGMLSVTRNYDDPKENEKNTCIQQEWQYNHSNNVAR